jgi:dihydrofolate synthase / folylpolyglutamate synthase
VTYEEACTFLFSLERRGVRLGLDRIVGAFRDHGDPQESFSSVLVAGTNGKGSVSAIVASCLQAAGSRTGLFTSPHLLDFRERMRVDGWMIRPEEVVDLVGEIRGSIDRWELSFFEATTLMAFLWFRDRGVESAAVEVGLGGRLDATRPVRASVTVVTTITLDHVKILGDTRAAIAAEKGGILRSGVPTAVGVSSKDALAVLRARAAEVGSPFHERRRCMEVTAIEATGRGSRFRIARRDAERQPEAEMILPLRGRHQVANATLAVLALSLLPEAERPEIEAIRAGIERVRWPARCETILDRPLLLCDVAHNPDGARSLLRTLREQGNSDLILVVGMVEGKDHERFLRTLAPCVRFVHYCTPRTERALPGETLAAAGAAVGLRGTIHGTPSEAVTAALESAGEDDAILVTGSFYTVGESLAHLGHHPDDPLWAAEGKGLGV